MMETGLVKVVVFIDPVLSQKVTEDIKIITLHSICPDIISNPEGLLAVNLKEKYLEQF